MEVNKNDFKVSVVIPVYNAAAFVTQAVESALAQPEVREVILVEDCSPDDSLAVCQQLARLYPLVRLFQHPGGVNRGAGPSRNLGITSSTCPYIAFLDADDFYLPDRFTASRDIFEKNSDCDGVYDAVGMYYEDEASRERWREHSITGEGITTLLAGIDPTNLFSVLIRGGQGHIHLNGLIVRRQVLSLSGLMDETIADTLHEDTDWVLRLSAVGKLYLGSVIEQTSMRRVHQQNRVSAPRSNESIKRDRIRLRIATYNWLRHHGTTTQRKLAFRRLLLEWNHGEERLGNSGELIALLRFPFRLPFALLEGHYWYELAQTGWSIIRNDWLKFK